MGLHETNRVMMNTYLTFARLFQGSVKSSTSRAPSHRHVGVAIADKGSSGSSSSWPSSASTSPSINFLPMPIADGGHMVFLIYEQLTGRPPSARFQNAAAVTGLVILGTLSSWSRSTMSATSSRTCPASSAADPADTRRSEPSRPQTRTLFGKPAAAGRSAHLESQMPALSVAFEGTGVRMNVST